MSETIKWGYVLSLPRLATTACGLAMLSEVAIAKDPCLVYRPREYVRHARYSMTRALELQAAEARTLTQTVWNHHFEHDSEELRAAGRAHLDRLARKYPYGNFELSIQSAHDFRFTEGDVDAYFSHRRELDALRTKTVTDYLQRVIPGIPIAIQIHDRPPVGLGGAEALRGYSQMVNKASVTIPDDSNGPQFMFGQGMNSGGFGGGGYGGGGMGDGGMGGGLTAPSTEGATPPSLGSDTPSGPLGGPSSGPIPSPNP